MSIEAACSLSQMVGIRTISNAITDAFQEKEETSRGCAGAPGQ